MKRRAFLKLLAFGTAVPAVAAQAAETGKAAVITGPVQVTHVQLSGGEMFNPENVRKLLARINEEVAKGGPVILP